MHLFVCVCMCVGGVSGCVCLYSSVHVFVCLCCDRFEFQPGTVVRFGVKGEWLSEYVPDPSAVFYFSKDGTEVSVLRLL